MDEKVFTEVFRVRLKEETCAIVSELEEKEPGATKATILKTAVCNTCQSVSFVLLDMACIRRASSLHG